MEVLVGNDEWLTVLQGLKRDGKVRALGISVRSPDDGLVVIEKFGFDCIQVNFNLTDQRALENGLFEQCEKNNIGVIVRTPLCFGFLTGGYPPGTEYDPSDHRTRWSFEQRRRWAEAHELFARVGVGVEGQSPAQFALKFCLSYRSVSTVIPGMLTKEQVEDNVAASGAEILSDDQRHGIEKVYRETRFFIC
jgi:aryl-alcohol dehydrogenase-like predicted oxidoreductase